MDIFKIQNFSRERICCVKFSDLLDAQIKIRPDPGQVLILKFSKRNKSYSYLIMTEVNVYKTFYKFSNFVCCALIVIYCKIA